MLRGNQIVGFLYWLTDPVLAPARALWERFAPENSLPVDFSPIITYLAIIVLRGVIRALM
jgi:uncharacterized protein YggT (Ycf19 family)